jgi:hypothetical protein
VVTDIYPFHLQARKVGELILQVRCPFKGIRSFKLNIWTMGFIISPFLSPFAFGFLVARARYVGNSRMLVIKLTLPISAGGEHMALDLSMALWSSF